VRFKLAIHEAAHAVLAVVTGRGVNDNQTDGNVIFRILTGVASHDQSIDAWERFFDEFERANLAFIYRDTGPNGALDDLHEFISRSAVPELTVSAQSTILERIG